MVALRLRGLGTVPPMYYIDNIPFCFLLRPLQEPAKFANWSDPKYCCTLFELRTMLGTADKEGQVGDWGVTAMVVLLLILV